jgi:7-cyano-7-deazaguanine synthase
MKPRSIILLSGGLDSTVNAAIARRRTRPLFAMTFDYSQRAVRMEVAASKKICRLLKIEHKAVRLPFFEEFDRLIMLHGKTARISQFRRTCDVWVPNRNALFINIAACYAEYYGASIIVTGFNRDEAQEFPDNSEGFLRAVNRSLEYGTRHKVKVKSYTLKNTKKEIYRLGLRYKAPLQHVYSCYLGGKEMCGRCASCKRLIEARK